MPVARSVETPSTMAILQLMLFTVVLSQRQSQVSKVCLLEDLRISFKSAAETHITGRKTGGFQQNSIEIAANAATAIGRFGSCIRLICTPCTTYWDSGEWHFRQLRSGSHPFAFAMNGGRQYAARSRSPNRRMSAPAREFNA